MIPMDARLWPVPSIWSDLSPARSRPQHVDGDSGPTWSPSQPHTRAESRGSRPFEGGCVGETDSPLEGSRFELVWGFPCQVVFFGLLPVLCSEREVAVLHPVATIRFP